MTTSITSSTVSADASMLGTQSANSALSERLGGQACNDDMFNIFWNADANKELLSNCFYFENNHSQLLSRDFSSEFPCSFFVHFYGKFNLVVILKYINVIMLCLK
jgi:hypothetical protein